MYEATRQLTFEAYSTTALVPTTLYERVDWKPIGASNGHKSEFKEHPIQLTSDLNCDFCGESFEKESVYGSHLKREHGISKKDVGGCMCPVCGEGGFSPKNGVRNHCSQKHGERIPIIKYECDTCGKTDFLFKSFKYNPNGSNFCTHQCYSTSNRYSEEELLAHLKDVSDRIGGVPDREAVERFAPPSARVYADRFGSVPNAVWKIGLAPKHPRNWSDRQYLDHLLQLAEKLGKTPTYQDMIDCDGPTPRGYERRFGTYNEALRKAGLTPNHVVDYSPEFLLDHLSDLADELERTPTRWDVVESDGPAMAPYVTEFGGYNDAVREIGLQPNYERGRWSATSLYEAIVRHLPGEPWTDLREEHGKQNSCSIEGCDGEEGRNASAHHTIPVLAGGVNSHALIMPLCRSCHRTVESYTRTFCDKVIEEIAYEESAL